MFQNYRLLQFLRNVPELQASTVFISVLSYPGVPLAVVIIVIAIDKDNYGLRNYGKYSDSAGDEL